MKKLVFLVALVSVFLLEGCSQSSDISDSVGEAKFRVTNSKQYADGKSSAVSLDHLALLVYKNDSLCKKVVQTSPSFDFVLPEGTYDAVFVGYFKNRELITDNGLHALSFEEGYVPNTFWECDTLSVSERGTDSKNITLKHICAAFTLVCEDYEELSEMQYMDVKVFGGYNVFDGSTGRAIKTSSDRETRYSITSSVFENGDSLNVYTYLPADSAVIDSIMVTALDGSNGIIKSRLFRNVPLYLHCKSVYTGNFCSSDEIEVKYSWSVSGLENVDWEKRSYSF